MSEFDTNIPTTFDPFAEANDEDSGVGTKEYVHVRVQQRNERKILTTVQGLKKEFSYSKILKDLKKEFCCNGTVVEDPELGQFDILSFDVVDAFRYMGLLRVTTTSSSMLFLHSSEKLMNGERNVRS
ncbi:hypothetical protein RYX36_015263 [Vicia faba]